jgi:hypothetical protein
MKKISLTILLHFSLVKFGNAYQISPYLSLVEELLNKFLWLLQISTLLRRLLQSRAQNVRQISEYEFEYDMRYL